MERRDLSWPLVVPEGRSKEARRQRMVLFAEWLLTPAEMRVACGMPGSQVGLAEALGVHEVTLSAWKQHAEFHAIMQRQVRSNVAAADLAAIVQNLVRIATGETPQAVPAARELLRWFKESATASELDADLSKLSDEELAARLDEVS